MQDKKESTATASENAFSGAFLQRFAPLDQAHTAKEAELSGPWRVEAVSGGFGTFRASERSGSDTPEAVFTRWEHALLAMAVLPAVGREPLFHLDRTDRPEGYAVETIWGDQGFRAVGYLRRYDEEVAEALHIAESIVRSPEALASLMRAAGGSALELAGRILAQRLTELE